MVGGIVSSMQILLCLAGVVFSIFFSSIFEVPSPSYTILNGIALIRPFHLFSLFRFACLLGFALILGVKKVHNEILVLLSRGFGHVLVELP